MNLQLPWVPIQLALFLFYDSVLGLSSALMQDSKANALPLSDNHSPLLTLELGFSRLSLLTSGATGLHHQAGDASKRDNGPY